MRAQKPISREKFIKKLKERGSERYQDSHPFTQLLNSGKLTNTQLHAWILNWFYYQNAIPLRDGAIISRCPISDVRRIWVSRILIHDGYGEAEGGIEGWLRFAEASGLDRDVLLSARYLSGVRLAVDSLVEFARNSSWIEGVSTSLTQLFLPAVVEKRINALAKHYGEIVNPEGMRYFMSLSAQAKKDSTTALNLVLKYCDTSEKQEKAIDAVIFSEDVLWTILDSIYSAYVIRGIPLSASV